MTSTIVCSFTGEAEAILGEVRNAAAAEGVNFTGDGERGTFSGKLSGSYEVRGKAVSVTVTRKPWYAPWSMVEERLREFFSGR